jgi:Ran GTPase-activating protein (RanGAP) involved in mRNA processing and transport
MNLLALDSENQSKIFKGCLKNGRLVCKRLCEELSNHAAVLVAVELGADDDSLRPLIAENMVALRVQELKELCKLHGVDTRGKKEDMLRRLNTIQAASHIRQNERCAFCAQKLLAVNKTFPRGDIRLSIILRTFTKNEIALVLNQLSHIPKLTAIDFRLGEGRAVYEMCDAGLQALNQALVLSTSLTSLCFGEDSSSCLPSCSAGRFFRSIQNRLFITHLDIRFCNLTDDSAALVNMLRNTPLLTSLDLRGCCLSEDGAKHLGDGLQRTPLLRSLLLAKMKLFGINGLGSEGIRCLVPFLMNTPSLTELDFGECYIKDSGVQCLANDLLHHLTSLVSLQLCGNSFSVAGAESLCRVIASSCLCALTMLDLGNKKYQFEPIGDDSATSLAAVLHCLPLLATLGLAICRIQAPGAFALARGLANVPGLTSLDMSRNPIGRGAEALVGAARNLRRLNMSYTAVDPPDVLALCRRLRCTPALTDIDLGSVKLHAAGARALAAALRHLPALVKLGLNNSTVGPAGARHLIPKLLGAPRLTALDLSSNKLGADGVTHIAAVLRTHTALVTLLLPDNNALDGGAEAVAEAILAQGAPCLTQLDLGYNDISNRGATRLAKAARGAASLASLSLICNRIGKTGEAALVAAQRANIRLTSLDVR